VAYTPAAARASAGCGLDSDGGRTPLHDGQFMLEQDRVWYVLVVDVSTDVVCSKFAIML